MCILINLYLEIIVFGINKFVYLVLINVVFIGLSCCCRFVDLNMLCKRTTVRGKVKTFRLRVSARITFMVYLYLYL